MAGARLAGAPAVPYTQRDPVAASTPFPVTRVAITADGDRAGAFATALRAQGLTPVPCAVLIERPAADAAPLIEAARQLEGYDWVIVASVRAVAALTQARGRPWPVQLRTAAVGPATAEAIRAAGVARPAVVAPRDGAEALWETVSSAAWAGLRVLLPTTPGGRTLLADRLREAGASVHEVEAYRMEARAPEAIRRDWAAAAPDAVVLGSARAARALIAAIGAEALGAVRVVAIGATTAAALAADGVPCEAPPHASPEAVAQQLASPGVPAA